MKLPWKRLIRFEAADGRVLHGEPILQTPDADVGNFKASDQLQARVLEGHCIYDADQIKFSGETVVVKKLLGPLTAQEVPSIRCVGLNYAKHSKCLSACFWCKSGR